MAERKGSRGEASANRRTKRVSNEELERDIMSVNTKISEHSDTLKEHNEILRRVEHKVFNGFGQRIEAVNSKLDREIVDNAERHKQLQESINSMGKVAIGAIITLFVGLLTILGSIWISDRNQAVEFRSVIESVARYKRNVPSEPYAPATPYGGSINNDQTGNPQ